MTDVTPTDEEPILRVFAQPFRGSAHVTQIAVGDIDSEFPREALTWLVVEALVAEGAYDDSDGHDTTCVFTTDRPERVKAQLAELVAKTKAEGHWCHLCLEEEGANGASEAVWEVIGSGAASGIAVGTLLCEEHTDAPSDELELVGYVPAAVVVR
jgi:hypothetical protein